MLLGKRNFDSTLLFDFIIIIIITIIIIIISGAPRGAP